MEERQKSVDGEAPSEGQGKQELARAFKRQKIFNRKVNRARDACAEGVLTGVKDAGHP